jgi:polyisoprenoid-binding protein YceI
VARYRIVADRSTVWIDARSSLHPIRSETSGLVGFFTGEVSPAGRIDTASAVSALVELPVAALSSGNPLYDREMRRRVDARRFPVIRGELREIKETGQEGTYLVRGDVTFRGVTRAYEEEVVVRRLDHGALEFSGAHVFDIRDFGMEPPRILMLRVHPEVDVRVRIVAVPEG